MDAVDDLQIGNVLEQPLREIWRSERAQQIRASFGGGGLNETCRKCEMYRDLEIYRTLEGLKRAKRNLSLASQPPRVNQAQNRLPIVSEPRAGATDLPTRA